MAPTGSQRGAERSRAFERVALGLGLLLVGGALAVLVKASVDLAAPDYVSAILLTLIGLSMLHAGAELLRPAVGE